MHCTRAQFIIKDLPSALILIIADQWLNDSLCCSNKSNWCVCIFLCKLYILRLTFLINFLKIVKVWLKYCGLNLRWIKWLWNPAQVDLYIYIWHFILLQTYYHQRGVTLTTELNCWYTPFRTAIKTNMTKYLNINLREKCRILNGGKNWKLAEYLCTCWTGQPLSCFPCWI